jgi:tetratricopeptide (TPR) repeat protein
MRPDAPSLHALRPTAVARARPLVTAMALRMQLNGVMRNTIVIASLLTACATTGGSERMRAGADASTAAVAALVRGDHAAALASADRGLAKHADDPWLWYNRGVALAGLGRVDEALASLQEAEQRFADPHDRSLAVYRRALTLEFAGRCAEASTELSRYAALIRPTQPALADAALGHVGHCIAPTAQELALRAETAQLRLAAADPTRRHADAASTAAVERLIAGDYAGALTKAEAALAIAPSDPWLWYDKGTALAGLNRVDDALPILREAEQRFASADVHGRAVATYRRALALETAGRCEEERAELDHYASLVGRSQPRLVEDTRAHLRFCRLARTQQTF